MPARKPTDLVQTGLRMREDLRRRVMAEAKKKNIPFNRELHLRIEASFETSSLRTLEEITTDLAGAWSRIRKSVNA
jgi:hypothetical protein